MVYFIQEDTGELGFIKIGYVQSGRDAASRLRGLQTGNARPLVVRAILRKHARMMEERLHAHFKRLRLTGEWFAAAPMLTEFMAWAALHPNAGAPEIEARLSLRPKKRISARQLAIRENASQAQRLLLAIDSAAVKESRVGGQLNQRERPACPICAEPIELGEEMIEAAGQTEFVHADCVPADEFQAT